MNSMHEWCWKCGSARKHQSKFHRNFLGSQPQLRTQQAIRKLTTGLLRHCWEGENYYYSMTIVTDVLGQTVDPIFKGQAAEDCEISQKSEDLIYTKAEAWNHA